MTPARRHAIQALIWGLYLAISLLGVRAYTPLTSGVLAIFVLVAAGCWAASEALRAALLRSGWLDHPRRLLVALLLLPVGLALAVQVGVGAGSWLLIAAGWVRMPPDAQPPGWLARLGYTVNTAIVLWLWAGAWVAWRYARRWREGEIARWKAEAARRALELEVLRGQLNPHFIFNALNNLRALISEDPTRAREAVGQLAGTLRQTLLASRRDRVPLAEELALVRDYLALEALHYEDRLHVRWDIAPGHEAAAVPPMLLQLLVENAIKHGIAARPGGGEIGIAVQPAERASADAPRRLSISVCNPGRWIDGGAPSAGTGIGLANLRERLLRVGGAGAECRVESGDDRVAVTLLLPLAAATEPAAAARGVEAPA
jgi:hypothetical protein